jgi:hypothetical protein
VSNIEIVYKKYVSSAYDYNVAYLKKYGDRYKVQVLKCVRKKGVSNINYNPKGTVNDKKLDCNIRRAKNTIKELVLCNDWDYFITLTLDKEKYDRYNLQKFNKDLSQYIRDLRKKYNTDIKYLLIPEQHKDGAWHMHGFLMGLPKSELQLFDIEQKLPYYILNKLKNGEEIYNWLGYQKRFGNCDIEPIRDKERVSSYVTKYVTKDLENSIKELNAKMYYCSRGLNRSKVIKKGRTTEKYKPSYIKQTDDGEFLYSEQWLPPMSEEQAELYVYNSMGWQSIQDEYNPFFDSVNDYNI